MAGKETVIREMIAPAVEALGYQLWGIEYMSQGKHTLLRIFIDGPEGIQVDDCAKVSHQVSGILDVEDPISGEYNLEVSSPGLDRPLFELEQYQQYIGSQLKLRLRSSFEGRKKFTGILAGVENDEIVLAVDSDEYLLPIELIEKANVVPQF